MHSDLSEVLSHFKKNNTHFKFKKKFSFLLNEYKNLIQNLSQVYLCKVYIIQREQVYCLGEAFFPALLPMFYLSFYSTLIQAILHFYSEFYIKAYFGVKLIMVSNIPWNISDS